MKLHNKLYPKLHHIINMILLVEDSNIFKYCHRWRPVVNSHYLIVILKKVLLVKNYYGSKTGCGYFIKLIVKIDTIFVGKVPKC